MDWNTHLWVPKITHKSLYTFVNVIYTFVTILSLISLHTFSCAGVLLVKCWQGWGNPLELCAVVIWGGRFCIMYQLIIKHVLWWTFLLSSQYVSYLDSATTGYVKYVFISLHCLQLVQCLFKTCLFVTGPLLGPRHCCLQLSWELLNQTTSHLTLHFFRSSATHPPSAKPIGRTVVAIVEGQTETSF